MIPSKQTVACKIYIFRDLSNCIIGRMTGFPKSYLLYGNKGYIPQNVEQVLKTSQRFIFLFWCLTLYQFGDSEVPKWIQLEKCCVFLSKIYRKYVNLLKALYLFVGLQWSIASRQHWPILPTLIAKHRVQDLLHINDLQN